MDIWKIILEAYNGYASYLWKEITFQVEPWWKNYFWWLLLISAFFYLVELIRPWRKDQPKFRKDFWLDFFYMFFNFFIFSLLIFNAASTVVVEGIDWLIKSVSGFSLQASNPIKDFPFWAILLIGFLVRDFVQWNIHRLLHRVPFLWEFHKVHHSVEQMGFAAHLRYHWMENIVYRTIEYLPLALLGIGLYDFFIIHIFTLAVGHYNHSNIKIPEPIKGFFFGAFLGLFVGILVLSLSGIALLIALTLGIMLGVLLNPYIKYIFNSPEMHIWHHAYEMPEHLPYGMNFGLTLSIWDYIWKTDHIPHNRGDIRLGFPGIEDFPEDFQHQLLQGFSKEKKKH